jgi:hypothetical protein
MEDTTCDGCRFAILGVGDDKIPNVKCRRYPAQIFVLNDRVSQSFPDAIHRCGEYKREPVSILETLKQRVKEAEDEFPGSVDPM